MSYSPTSVRSPARISCSSCGRARRSRRCSSSVVSTLVVFHFALPAGSSDLAAHGLLWVALLFTALLGPGARLRCRAGAGGDRRRSSSRRATGARSGSARRSPSSRFLAAVELIALPAYSFFFHGRHAARSAGSRWQTSGSAPSGRSSRPMAAAGRARELLLPLLFLPLAIPVVIGGVGASVADDRGPLPWLPRSVRRALCDHLLGFL